MSSGGPKSVGKDGSISPSRMTLMERQAFEKGDVSMIATLRIGELDKLVAGVKQKQAICLAAVAQYESEIGFIDQEMQHIMERYTPVVKRLEARKQERKELIDQSGVAVREFGDILATTKQRLRNTTRDQVRNLRHEATNELSGARGYPVGRESTVYQKIVVARK